MVLEKVNKRGGVNGKWKIVQWIIRSSLPQPIPVAIEQDYEVTIPKSGGMHARFHLSMHGTTSLQSLIDSRLYLDIDHHRIGYEKRQL